MIHKSSPAVFDLVQAAPALLCLEVMISEAGVIISKVFSLLLLAWIVQISTNKNRCDVTPVAPVSLTAVCNLICNRN